MLIDQKIRNLFYEILNTYKYRPDTKNNYNGTYCYSNFWVGDNSNIDNIYILGEYGNGEMKYERAFYIKGLKELAHDYNFINALSLYLIFNFDVNTINNLLLKIKVKVIPNLYIGFSKCKGRYNLVEDLYTIFQGRSNKEIAVILDIFAFDLE